MSARGWRRWLPLPVCNRLYGRSKNQEMFDGLTSVPLEPNDYTFLRPNQSEAVFLQLATSRLSMVNRSWALWRSLGPITCSTDTDLRDGWRLLLL